MLRPEKTWPDPAAYHQAAQKLGALFRQNFVKYADHAGDELRSAAAAGFSGRLRCSILLLQLAVDKTCAILQTFLEKRGEGLHHLVFTVDDIIARIAELKQSGLWMIDEVPRWAHIKCKWRLFIARALAEC